MYEYISSYISENAV